MYPVPVIGHPGWHVEEAVRLGPPVAVRPICSELRRVPNLLNEKVRTSIRSSSPANSPSISSGPKSLLPLRKISPSSVTQLLELAFCKRTISKTDVHGDDRSSQIGR